MFKTILLALFLNATNSLWATEQLTTIVDSKAVIEHQIRLCDDQKNIFKKLNLQDLSGKKRIVLYAETANRFYQQNNWTIRLKIKSEKVEIDVKRRMGKNEATPESSQVECEYDRHGSSVEKTCKLSHEISFLKLSQIISGGKNWSAVLSTEQKKWLTEKAAFREDVLFYGSLKNIRHGFKHPEFGDVTVDLVHLAGNDSVTYHEISIRYPKSEEGKKADLFEDYVKSEKLITCPDQIDWSINKFDVMNPVEELSKINWWES